MTRKITKEALYAFWNGDDFRKDNTEVRQSLVGTNLYLHGNEIARLVRNFDLEQDEICITTAGWDTTTTKERLRAIPGVNSLVTKKGVLFLNGKEWDGEWKAVGGF